MKNNEKGNQKETVEFLQAQEEFLKNGSARAWSVMWSVGLIFTRKITNKILHNTHFKMSVDDFDDKTMYACEYVLRRYKKKYKDGRIYKIESSPCSAFYFAVIHALYYENRRKNKDALTNAIFFDDLNLLQKKALQTK